VIEQVTDQLRKRAQVRRKLGQEMDAREAEVEIARRTAFPLATIVFVLLGAPLGLQPRRAGKSLGFGLSVLLTFGYWSLLQLGMSIGKGGALPPDLAVQLPNIIGVITGIVLIKRVAS
jgi:lipopolysaccharide export system permease protein